MPIEAGDIMIKRSDGSAVSNVIQAGQNIPSLGGLRSLGPSAYTHAGIASSAHTIIEMGGGGLVENGLPTKNAHYDYAVFRSTTDHNRIAAGVTSTAIMMLEIAKANVGAASYTVAGAFKSLFKSKRIAPGSGDVASLILDKMLGDGGASFFCSGFVVLCYQIVSSQMGVLSAAVQSDFPIQDAGSLFSRKASNYQPSFLYKTVAESLNFQAVGMFRGETYQGAIVGSKRIAPPRDALRPRIQPLVETLAGRRPVTAAMFAPPLKIQLVVVRGRGQSLHPLGQQRAKTGPRLDRHIPLPRRVMPEPVDAAEIVGNRELRCRGDVRHAEGDARNPAAVVEQIVEVIEVAFDCAGGGAQGGGVGRLTADDALEHAFGEQRHDGFGVEFLVEPRRHAPRLGPFERATAHQRRALDGFLEIFDDRGGVRQHEIALGEHRRLAGRVQLGEAVATLPRQLAHQFDRDPLLGADDPDFAAERA